MELNAPKRQAPLISSINNCFFNGFHELLTLCLFLMVFVNLSDLAALICNGSTLTLDCKVGMSGTKMKSRKCYPNIFPPIKKKQPTPQIPYICKNSIQELVVIESQKAKTKSTMQDLLFDFIAKYITLNEEEKNALLALDIFHSVKKGTVLLKEGQKTKESYFVLKGCIRTYYLIDGEEKTTAFYTEMDTFTPHCVINKVPSDYFVSCVEDSIVVISNADMGEEVNAKFPKFDIMCRTLSEELLAKQQIDFDAFKTSSPEQRYLNLLQKRPDLIQRVPQHQLASYLGIQPQSLSRLRARIFEKKN